MWQSVKDKHGRQYFYNSHTGVTTWEKPKELWTPQELYLHKLGWQRFTTKDGRPYWYNEKLQKSVWDPPEMPADISNSVGDSAPPSAKRTKVVDPADKTDLYSAFEQGGVAGRSYRDALPVLMQIEQFRNLENTKERLEAFENYQEQQGAQKSYTSHEQKFSEILDELENHRITQCFSEVEPRLSKFEVSSEEKKSAFEKFIEAGNILKRKSDPVGYEEAKRQLTLDLQAQFLQQSESSIDTTSILEILQRSYKFGIEEDDRIYICKGQVNEYLERVKQWLKAENNSQNRQDRHAREKYLRYLNDNPGLSTLDWKKIVEKKDQSLMQMCGRMGSKADELYAAYLSERRSQLAGLVETARSLMAEHGFTLHNISEEKLRELLLQSHISHVDSVIDSLFGNLHSEGVVASSSSKRIALNAKGEILPY